VPPSGLCALGSLWLSAAAMCKPDKKPDDTCDAVEVEAKPMTK